MIQIITDNSDATFYVDEPFKYCLDKVDTEESQWWTITNALNGQRAAIDTWSIIAINDLSEDAWKIVKGAAELSKYFS